MYLFSIGQKPIVATSQSAIFPAIAPTCFTYIWSKLSAQLAMSSSAGGKFVEFKRARQVESAEVRVSPTKAFPANAIPMVELKNNSLKNPLLLSLKQRIGIEKIFGPDSSSIDFSEFVILLSPHIQIDDFPFSLLNQQAIVVMCN
ncbi:hypothetical protein [Chromobacterium sp. ASV23]|uniref:hypothetical protein n=1 Tax=Chromobacterium sp. ASV23 TaxID=2795110 RepID=UPI0018EB4BED|nr:hypothetical protein [Chromobacterium sp. ASV23]